ncbi:MAG: hypothetical protein AB8H79_08460 [Myxococcota bacterium]
MIVLMTWTALAGQPGQATDIGEASVRGELTSGRSKPASFGIDVRVDTQKNWYARASADVRPGIDDELGFVLNRISGRDVTSPVESGSVFDQVYQLAIGGHTGLTSRERGGRASGGVLGVVHAGHQVSRFMLDEFQVSPDYHSEIRAGLESEFGWAFPVGSDIGDPLIVVSGRLIGELPVAAWGGELGNPDRGVLQANGVRTSGGLVAPRADTQARVSLTVQHFRGSLALGRIWRFPSASIRRNANVAGRVRGRQQLVASAGVIF